MHMPRASRTLSAFLGLAAIGIAGPALAAALSDATAYTPTGTYNQGVSTSTGRLITPVGATWTTGNWPAAIAVNPDQKTAVVVNSGQGEWINPGTGAVWGGPAGGQPTTITESLQVIDLATGATIQTVTDHMSGSDVFYESGVTYRTEADGTVHLFVTGGGNDAVYDYTVNANGTLQTGSTSTTPGLPHYCKTSIKAGAPTIGGTQIGGVPATAPLVGDTLAYSKGVAVNSADRSDDTIYVVNEQGGTLDAIDRATCQLHAEVTIGGAGQAAGSYPEAVVVKGNTAYVAAMGLNAVIPVTFSKAISGVWTGTAGPPVLVGDHPTAMALGGNGQQLFVANANDDTVSVLDISGYVPRVTATVSTHLWKGEATGSAPNAITVDDSTGTIYVTNAGDNTVQVLRGERTDGGAIDPTTIAVQGGLPTGEYPSGVALAHSASGAVSSVLVTNAKGASVAPVTNAAQYDINNRPGILQAIPTPSDADLSKGETEAIANLKFPSQQADALRPADSPIPTLANAGQSPIKHVVVIVRENRTFDQVFGDLNPNTVSSLGTKPDVEPAYTQFGRYGLDYNHPTDLTRYTITPNIHDLANQFALSQNFYSNGEASIQGHHWTSEGDSTDYTEKAYLHYYSTRNHPYDVSAAIGYPRCGALFQQALNAGKSVMNFGELVGENTQQTAPNVIGPDVPCAIAGGTAAANAASTAAFDPTLGGVLTATTVSDVDKEAYVQTQLTGKDLPALTYLDLSEDHTAGLAAGSKTPQAHVATNDYAVGKFIDYLSHRPDWASTAVFVMEDDSQDGLDHRDGHRNIFLIASPYAKKGALSSMHTDQAAVLHMIELILGIPALSSYTQNSAVPWDMWQSTPDLTPYTAEMPTYNMFETNGTPVPGTPAASTLDLSQVDIAGPLLEAQIWQATHPAGTPLPSLLGAELLASKQAPPAQIQSWMAQPSASPTPSP